MGGCKGQGVFLAKTNRRPSPEDTAYLNINRAVRVEMVVSLPLILLTVWKPQSLLGLLELHRSKIHSLQVSWSLWIVS